MAGVLKHYIKYFFGTRAIQRVFTFTPSSTAGQGYTSGTGENIDFTAAINTNKSGRPVPPGPPAAPLPANDQIICTRVPAGYDAVISQAAASPTLKNFNMRIYTSGGTEISTADYPAGLKGSDIVFTVTTPAKYN